MTMEDAVRALGGEMLAPGAAAARPLRRVVASDLMSDVLLVDEEDILLLTSLASDQVLRTAQIVGAIGVVVVNGKPLPSSMTGVAADLGVALAVARIPKYEACVRLHEALARQP